ncbi:MAG: peptidoglycan -binding protein, partial [Rhodospirillales bacterium]|nr:peptidoglycan -binding protein [Rhodospirillales bacterium]
MVFVVAQFYLREALTGREKTLKDLSGQIAEIAEMLNLERANSAKAAAELKATIADRDDLSNRLGLITQRLEKAESEAWSSQSRAAEADKRAKDSQAGVDALVRQFLALQADRDRLARLLAEEAAKVRTSDQNSADLARQLAETTKTAEASQARADQLVKEIAGLQALKERLEAEVKDKTAGAQTAEQRAVDLETLLKQSQQSLQQNQQALGEEKAGAARMRDELAALNRQIAALREQLAQVSAALELSETKAKDQEVQIVDLGKRLNVALASKVQELARYRSEFFGRLRELLGERQDIRVVGDRFVFQSEVLFDSGSADIGPEGRKQLGELAGALKQIAGTIPPEVNWILRVDGHTDRQPIARLYRSNWELSFARALAVVRFLIAEGIPAERLAATGFGEFQPIDERDDEIGRRRNRRIELKFDQR